jgi:hypothetical protein
MAYGNQIQTRHSAIATASVGVVDLIVLTDGGYGVNVTNINGLAPIFFTVDAKGGACPVPTVNGASGEYCASSVGAQSVNVRFDGQFGSVVQLISSGTPTYSVSVIGNQSNA